MLFAFFFIELGHIEIFIAVRPGEPLVELGTVTCHGGKFLIHDGVDLDDSVRPERTGIGKAVKAVGKNRDLIRNGRIFAEVGHHTGVGTIHHQLCCGTVVGMIVAEAVGNDQIRIPFSQDTHDPDTVGDGGFKTAVLIGNDLIFGNT